MSTGNSNRQQQQQQRSKRWKREEEEEGDGGRRKTEEGGQRQKQHGTSYLEHLWQQVLGDDDINGTAHLVELWRHPTGQSFEAAIKDGRSLDLADSREMMEARRSIELQSTSKSTQAGRKKINTTKNKAILPEMTRFTLYSSDLAAN